MYFYHLQGYYTSGYYKEEILCFFLPVIKWNVVVSRKRHIRSFRDAFIRCETEIKSTERTLKK